MPGPEYDPPVVHADEEMARDQDAFFRAIGRQKVGEQAEAEPQVSEAVERNNQTIKTVTEEVQASGQHDSIVSGGNLAQSASQAAVKIEEGGEKLIVGRLEAVSESLPDDDRRSLHETLIAEDKLAGQQIHRENSQGERRRSLLWLYGLIFVTSGLVLADLILGLVLEAKKGSASASDGLNDGLSNEQLEANQTFLSLLMQAAADDPVAASSFGLSASAFQRLRQAVLDQRDSIPEDWHWQMLADQSTILFPPTQKPFTLGDHLLALDFQFELLNPLYDSQPIDLDVDATISALADAIDVSAECPMHDLFSRVMEFVPETTGANRLQRIVLVRSALARAIARLS